MPTFCSHQNHGNAEICQAVSARCGVVTSGVLRQRRVKALQEEPPSMWSDDDWENFGKYWFDSGDDTFM